MASFIEVRPGSEGSYLSNRDKEWERKQRNREYRVASRREKRNRKGDEKKQRKLNATILRRMTRNPDKYNKNAERNRLRDVEGERRRIWQEAVRQAQRLAAIHDPSGKMFNVGPVVLQEDGTVIAEESLRRREERARAKAAAERTTNEIEANTSLTAPKLDQEKDRLTDKSGDAPSTREDGLGQGHFARMEGVKPGEALSRLSKSQQKKRAALEPRPPPPKPTIPENVPIPEGEQNWVALWDLPDEELERRTIREKRRKAAERKALRIKQKSGKAERRMARDEKRRVYRDMKLTWKAIKEEQVRLRTKLKSMEDEESKKIAVDINIMERKAALDHCAALGFTLANTPGVHEIKPRALGMRGVDVDFDAIDIGESRSDIKLKQNTEQSNKRVNLGDAPKDAKAEYVPTGQRDDDRDGDIEEYIKLDVGEGQDFETLNYNHKLRRKLRRAIDNAETRKEMLVRQRAIDHYQARGVETPSILQTPYKPMNNKGQRILENGTFETSKQERVRTRMDLAEFNMQMRVLRKQAKDAAIYAGLRKHAELMGRLPDVSNPRKQKEGKDIPQADTAESLNGHQDSTTPASTNHTYADNIRNRDTNESSSTDSSSQSEGASRTSHSSSLTSDSDNETRVTKRRKNNSTLSNKMTESTNRDRQALIDAESAMQSRR